MGAIRWVASVAGALLTVGLISVYGLGPMGVRPNAVSPEELEAFPYEGEWFPMPHAAAAVRPPAMLRADGRFVEPDVPDVTQLARAEWPAALASSVFGATVVQATDIEDVVTLAYVPMAGINYNDKAYIRITLPDRDALPDKTVDSAVFKAFVQRVAQPGEDPMEVYAHTSIALWDSATDEPEDLDDINLGEHLDIEALDTDAVGDWYQWDITSGVAAAYAGEFGAVTVALVAPLYESYGAANFKFSDAAALGSNVVHPQYGFRVTGELAAYIEITFTGGGGEPGGGDPNPGTAGAGANSGTVGVLLF